MPLKNIIKPWCKVYFKDSNYMKEVKDESIQLIVTNMSEICVKGSWNSMKPAGAHFVPMKVIEAAKLEKNLFRTLSRFFPFSWLENMFKECYRVLKPDGVFFWNTGVSQQDYSSIFGSNRINCLLPYVWAENILQVTRFHIKEDFIWAKTSSAGLPVKPFSNGAVAYAHEHFFMFTKSDECKFHLPKNSGSKATFQIKQSLYKDNVLAKKNVRALLTVWFANAVPVSKVPEVPTGFSEEILQLLIETFTDKGDTVLDPLAGTGTLGKVATKSGRNCVLYEIREKMKPWIKAKVGDAYVEEQ